MNEEPSSHDLTQLHARMDVLSAANARILVRLDEIAQRLARLDPSYQPPTPFPEPPLAETAPSPPVQNRETEPVVELPSEVAPEGAPECGGGLEPEPVPAFANMRDEPAERYAGSPDETSNPETSFGLSWLNRIGAVTLMLAAAFFFKYAVDNGWIGPTGRVLIGLVTGSGLLVGAHFLFDRGHRLYSQGLAATGVAVLYLSIWAAASLYSLIPAGLALAALAAVTSLAGALASRTKSLALAVLGLLGAYLAPPALSTGEYHPWILFTYLLVMNAGWLTFARRMGWNALEFVALVGTLVLGGGMFSFLTEQDQGPAGSYFVLGQYLLFIHTPVRWLRYVVQAGATLLVGIAWERSALSFGLAAVPVVGAGLVVAHFFAQPLLALISVASFSVALSQNRGLYEPELAAVLAAGAVFLIAHAWMPYRLSRGHEACRVSLTLQPLNGVAFLLGAWPYFSLKHEAWVGAFAALVGGFYLVTAFLLKRMEAVRRDPNPLLISAGMALIFFTAAIPLHFDTFRITILWALEAAAVAWIARRLDSNPARISSIIIGALALVRLVSIDSVMYTDPAGHPLVLNPRFATFVLSAAGFALAAWWHKPDRIAVAPYLAALGALLGGVGLEVHSYAWRTAPEGNQISATVVSLSILMAAFAVALVGAGAATRTRLNRLLGLGLLSFTVVKLYLVDVWVMRRGYRIVAFLALGAMLLATSFLYSRFRSKIEEMLKDDSSAGGD